MLGLRLQRHQLQVVTGEHHLIILLQGVLLRSGCHVLVAFEGLPMRLKLILKLLTVHLKDEVMLFSVSFKLML